VMTPPMCEELSKRDSAPIVKATAHEAISTMQEWPRAKWKPTVMGLCPS